MRILVTGASGFVGREIVSELIKNNFEVFGVIGPKTDGKKFVSGFRVQFCTLDITDCKKFSELEKIGKIDVFIHSAGLAHQFGETKKEEFEAVNVLGTKNAVNLAVKLRTAHFILIGSTAVYGIEQTKTGEIKLKGANAISEDSPVNPQTLYAQSKLKSEQVCREICGRNKLPLTIFRLSPVIGEANVGNVSRLIRLIDQSRFLWIGNGENLKSLIYKTDVARACVELVKKKNGGTEIFNLAAQPIKMKNFVEEIAELLDRRIYKFSIPTNFVRSVFQINSKFIRSKKIYKIEDTIEKWLSDDVYSAAKIAEKYGFEPKTSVAEAIGKQVRWYKKDF